MWVPKLRLLFLQLVSNPELLASSAKWLNVRLRTKWFWVRLLLQTSDFAPASSKEFLDIQAAIECGFTRQGVRDITRTYRPIISVFCSVILIKVYIQGFMRQIFSYRENLLHVIRIQVIQNFEYS